MRLKVVIVLVLGLVWSVGSWKWYTCNIKGFCNASSEMVESANIDIDSDNDGLSDKEEKQFGTNPESMDSDGDGFSDRKEIGRNRIVARDTDSDGTIDALDDDDDNDGILTKIEALLATSAYSADSDNDGLLDAYELGDDIENPIDSDNDGLINAVDYDDDNDGIATLSEQADSNLDGDPSDAIDRDNNGIADYLDYIEEITVIEPAIYQAPTQVEIVIEQDNLARVHFPFNNAETPVLSVETEQYFSDLVDQINAGSSVALTGHTDDIGDANANLGLALSRAIMIKNLLIARGASADSIVVDSKGETEPLQSNSTELGRGTNRRVELLTTKY